MGWDHLKYCRGLGGVADGLEATLYPLRQLRLQSLAQGTALCSPTGSQPTAARATLLRGWWRPAPTTEAATDHIFTGFSFPHLLPSPPLLPSLSSSAPWDHSWNHCPINHLQPGLRREHERWTQSLSAHIHTSKPNVDPGQQRQHSPIFAD